MTWYVNLLVSSSVQCCLARLLTRQEQKNLIEWRLGRVACTQDSLDYSVDHGHALSKEHALQVLIRPSCRRASQN